MSPIVAIVLLFHVFNTEFALSVTDDDFLNAFEIMKADSITVLQDMGSKKPNKTQVLSIVVLSDEEVAGLNGIPEYRRRILVNKRRDKFPQSTSIADYFTTKNEEIHGEINALYIENTIPTLLEEYYAYCNTTVNRGKGIPRPNVLVYSYFIPCVGVLNVPYSCAEELAKAARFNSSIYDMHVAYSMIFNGTDGFAATDFLLNSGIKRVVDLNSNTLPEIIGPNKTVNLFQEKMHSCLKLQTVYCRNEEKRDKILAYQVNLLTKQCTATSLFYGAITTFGLNSLGSCLYSADWTPCCDSRSNVDRYKLAVKECLDNIMREYTPTGTDLLEFGEVRSITDSRWRRIDNMETKRWSSLFTDLVDNNTFRDDIVGIEWSGKPCISQKLASKANSDQFGKYQVRLNDERIARERETKSRERLKKHN